MKTTTIYKDLDLMERKEIEAYIDGFEEFMKYDDENYKYSPHDERKLLDYINDDINIWWEEASEELQRLMQGKKYKVIADLGFWYGRRQGHIVEEGFKAIERCLGSDSCSAFEI